VPALEDFRSALRGRTPSRVLEEVSQRAAVSVVLREGSPGIEILFIRRAEHPMDPWSGQMAFPGGRREPADSDLRETAIRETLEETGLDLRSAEVLGELDEIRAYRRMQPVDLAIQPFVFSLQEEGALVPSDEVRSLHWLSLDALLEPGSTGTFSYSQDGGAYQLPCLRQGDLLIWGLTYRMFMNLASLLPRTR
jgi:8-oxo-dGTP pyrophosphatase MutT (NUDIX family)